MNLDDHIACLQEATAHGAPTEHLLLREPTIQISQNGTPHSGASTTYVVVFASRRQAIFKPFAGQHPNTCAAYSQNPYEAVTHEVAAWRLAHALGGQSEQMVPAAVLRDLPGVGAGVLINWRDGQPDHAVFQDARAQARAAAFWDALVGQQDRHATNFRYDRQYRRLALIDHAFSFARPGDLCHEALFLRRRRSEHGTALQASEKEALERLLESDDLMGLRRFIASDRADALEERAQSMLKRKVLPMPGTF